MTKNLLALLLALQKATINHKTQQYLLPQLGNQLDVVKDAWQNAHASIEAILQQESGLKEHYQQFQSQLGQMTDEEIHHWLSDVELSVISDKIATLGYKPTPLCCRKDLLIDNIAFDISRIISRNVNSEENKALLKKLPELPANKKMKE